MYSCGHCAEKFTSSQSLDCHMQIHTGVSLSELTRMNPGLERLLWNVSNSPSVAAEVVRYRCENCDLLFNRITRCSDKEFSADSIQVVQRCERCVGNKSSPTGFYGTHADPSSESWGSKIEPRQSDNTEKYVVIRENHPHESVLRKDKLKGTEFDVITKPAAETGLQHLAYRRQPSRYARLTRREAKCTENRSGHCRTYASSVPSSTCRATRVRDFTEQRPHQCLFHAEKNLKRHTKFRTGEKPYQCEVCKKQCTTGTRLKVHMRVHTGEKPYQCEVCKKQFTDGGNLKVHMRVHSGEKPYQCEVCMKRFSRSGSLTYHIKTHTGEKPYQCEVCNEQFRIAHQLKVHTRIHTGDNPYQCSICKKQCCSASTLTIHTRIHTGEKPNQCKVCKKQFYSASMLTTHTRVHTGEKPYQCEVCRKQFTQSCNLTTHMRIHTDEKPYQCKVCRKQFSQSSTLTTHMRTHTEDNLSNSMFVQSRL